MSSIKLTSLQLRKSCDPRCHAPLPLRIDDRHTLPFDRWRRDAPDSSPFPVAFVTSEQGKNRVGCRLEIEYQGDREVEVHVSATSVDQCGVLGDLRGAKFKVQPGTNVCYVDLTGATIAGAVTDIRNVSLEWRLCGGGSSDQTITHLRVYLLPGMPSKPWDPSGEDPLHTPWVKALECACDWARGSKNSVEAAQQITERLYLLGRTPHCKYPGETVLTYSQRSHFTDNARRMRRGTAAVAHGNTRYEGTFFLGRFLRLLKGDEDLLGVLNCTDCASIVSTLTNLLGGELCQARISEGAFTTHPIRLIGGKYECDGVYFIFHEVAWCGERGPKGRVWDACLAVDGDGDPTAEPFNELLPINLPFGPPEEQNSYLFWLVPWDVASKMEPPAAYMIRRPLVVAPPEGITPIPWEARAPWVWPKPHWRVPAEELRQRLFGELNQNWELGPWSDVPELYWATVPEARCRRLDGEEARWGSYGLRLYILQDAVTAQDALCHLLGETSCPCAHVPLAGSIGD